jgi:hypothetical protein
LPWLFIFHHEKNTQLCFFLYFLSHFHYKWNSFLPNPVAKGLRARRWFAASLGSTSTDQEVLSCHLLQQTVSSETTSRIISYYCKCPSSFSIVALTPGAKIFQQ